MVQVVVLADPPRDGLVLPGVPETSPLSTGDARRLYAAFLRDAVAAAAASGGELLVNYRPEETLPGANTGDEDAESAVRDTVDAVLSDPDGTRIEPQVGSTRSARVGNTVTHLLEEEDATSVVVVDPLAPTFGRTDVDEVAMKLRRSEVVVAPASRGRAAAMGFKEPVNFEGVLDPPALSRLTDRAVEGGLDVDLTDLVPLVETGTDLATLVALVRARATAGLPHSEHTAEAVADLDLRVDTDDGGAAVVRGTDSS